MVTAALLAPRHAPPAPKWSHTGLRNVLCRWYSDDGRARTSTLAIEWPDDARPDDEFVLIRTSGPELDSDVLDELYDDVARDVLHESHPARRLLGAQDATLKVASVEAVRS